MVLPVAVTDPDPSTVGSVESRTLDGSLLVTVTAGVFPSTPPILRFVCVFLPRVNEFRLSARLATFTVSFWRTDGAVNPAGCDSVKVAFPGELPVIRRPGGATGTGSELFPRVTTFALELAMDSEPVAPGRSASEPTG